MAQQPRGRPPSQAPPPAGRGRNALSLLGGGVLVLAVAGGAWFAFGRDSTQTVTNASSNPTSTSAPPVFGPAAPPVKSTPKASATSTQPAAAPTSAATKPATQSPVVKPTAAVRATTPAPVPTATKAPVVVGPVAQPPVAKPPVVGPQPSVTGPQSSGTVAKKDYTFKVARGDTLWNYTVSVLKDSGRSTSNANVAALVSKFYAQNTGVVGSDPNLIRPGQTIVWPTGL